MLKNKKIYFSVFILIIIVVSFFNVNVNKVFARSVSSFPSDLVLSGTAWSPNLGQISFNDCTDATDSTTCLSASGGIPYEVVVDHTSHTLSGWAWSDHAGWIQFGNSICETSSDCGATATLDSTTGDIVAITGWARAKDNTTPGLSSFNGWDGYISLGSPASSYYGVIASASTNNGIIKTQNLSGTAWGSSVVGEVDMSGVNIDSYVAPACNITANPASITAGTASSLTWTSAGSTSCTASGAWSGTVATSNSTGQSTGNLAAGIHVYTLVCSGSGGSSYPCSATVAAGVALPPTVTLSANPTSTSINGSSTLTWTSTNATSCAASGAWSGSKTANATSTPVSSSQTITYIMPPKTYTITCTGPGGTTAPVSATVGLKTIVFNLGIDASCSTTTHYACASGDDDSNSNFWDGSSHTWTWSCLGQNGGTNQSCSLAFNPANCAPAELIDPPTNIPCYCSNSANISAAVCLKRPGYIEN